MGFVVRIAYNRNASEGGRHCINMRICERSNLVALVEYGLN